MQVSRPTSASRFWFPRFGKWWQKNVRPYGLTQARCSCIRHHGMRRDAGKPCVTQADNMETPAYGPCVLPKEAVWQGNTVESSCFREWATVLTETWKHAGHPADVLTKLGCKRELILQALSSAFGKESRNRQNRKQAFNFHLRTGENHASSDCLLLLQVHSNAKHEGALTTWGKDLRSCHTVVQLFNKFLSYQSGAVGVVVSHMLSMQKALGATSRLSIVLPSVVCIDFGGNTSSGSLWNVSLTIYW